MLECLVSGMTVAEIVDAPTLTEEAGPLQFPGYEGVGGVRLLHPTGETEQR